MEIYSFDNFVVLGGNRFAWACAMAVADGGGDPGASFFLHGGAGLGKTHLTHAIKARLEVTSPGLRIRLVSGDSFMREMIAALRKKKMNLFRSTLLDTDLFIFDDFDALDGLEGSQMEFIDTLDALLRGGKPVVITSGRPLEGFSTLNPRLHSRILGMINVTLLPPTREELALLLLRLVEKVGVSVPQAALEMIAERHPTDFREMEGMLTSLDAYGRLIGPLSNEKLTEVLEGYGGGDPEDNEGAVRN